MDELALMHGLAMALTLQRHEQFSLGLGKTAGTG